MSDKNNPPLFRSLRFRYGLGLVLILITAGGWLWQDYQAQIVSYLPLILLLGVCGGMHFFMHGGHKHDPANRPSPDQKDHTD